MTYKHLNSLNSFFGDRKDTAAAAAGQTFQTFIVFAEWKVLLLDWGELVLDSRRAQDSESVSNSSAAALKKQCDDFSVSADCAGTTVICHTSKISMYYTWWIQMCNVAPTKDGFCENDWSTSSQSEWRAPLLTPRSCSSSLHHEYSLQIPPIPLTILLLATLYYCVVWRVVGFCGKSFTV